jgi:hypothetical protein
MGISNWLKNKIAALSIALSNVEKNTFSQSKESSIEDTQKIQRYQQGTLSDALLHGEITQEVKNLRWRTYKILKASEGIKLKLNAVDKDGDFWYETKKTSDAGLLNKVILDQYDSYPLEMVVTNDESVLSNLEVINDELKQYDTPIKNTNSTGEIVSASHGEINSTEYFTLNKGEKRIQVIRESYPRFFIERFTKKLNIRTINETEKLIEFYVSKYPDVYNKTSQLFLREIGRLIDNGPQNINFIDISGVEFITENTLGAEDFTHYQYDIKSFDKVVEFDGNYVIKFLAEVVVNGNDILSKYVEPELEIKYQNKERKN